MIKRSRKNKKSTIKPIQVRELITYSPAVPAIRSINNTTITPHIRSILSSPNPSKLKPKSIAQPITSQTTQKRSKKRTFSEMNDELKTNDNINNNNDNSFDLDITMNDNINNNNDDNNTSIDNLLYFNDNELLNNNNNINNVNLASMFLNEPNSPRLAYSMAPIIPQHKLDDFAIDFELTDKHRKYHETIQWHPLYVFVYDNNTVLFGYFINNKLSENFYICELRQNVWRCDKDCAEYSQNQSKQMAYKCFHSLLANMILNQSNPTRISVTYLQSNNSILSTEPFIIHFLKAPTSGRKRWVYLLINPSDHNRKSTAWLNYPAINQKAIQCSIAHRSGCLEEHAIKDV